MTSEAQIEGGSKHIGIKENGVDVAMLFSWIDGPLMYEWIAVLSGKSVTLPLDPSIHTIYKSTTTWGNGPYSTPGDALDDIKTFLDNNFAGWEPAAKYVIVQEKDWKV